MVDAGRGNGEIIVAEVCEVVEDGGRAEAERAD